MGNEFDRQQLVYKNELFPLSLSLTHISGRGEQLFLACAQTVLVIMNSSSDGQVNHGNCYTRPLAPAWEMDRVRGKTDLKEALLLSLKIRNNAWM